MPAESSSRQLVVFSIGSEEYALPIAHVQEIIRFTEPRSVVADRSWVRGVIGLRGAIVPVYDLASRLGIPRSEHERKIVIVETDGERVGIVVEDVEEVLTVEAEQLEVVPAADAGATEAIAKLDERLIVLLNVDGLFGNQTALAA